MAIQSFAASALPPHRYYYLHNFQRALDWIAAHHADLLDASEADFLSRIAGLPLASRALLVRLAMRKGPYFRAARLRYDEIPDLHQAAAPLAQAGWLDAAPRLELAALFALHTRAELAALFPGSARPGLRKAEWLQALLPHHAEARPYAAWRPGCGEAVWQLRIGALCDRLRLMFFGNLRQDWSEFVLADLGIFRYEPVAFDATSRAFRCRADVDAYLQLHACREALEADAAPLGELLAQAQACAGEHPWLQQRRDKLLLRIGQAAERRRDWDTALQAHALSRHPEARHRRLRVLERQGRHAEALEQAETACAAPGSEAEAQRLARMLPRLRRAAGRPAVPAPACPAPPVTQLALPVPASATRVEIAVRNYLATPQAPVHYVENALINALFGLLCWEAIYAPLPGAFFHPFQRGPADLHAPDFAARRAPLLQACLARLEGPAYRDTILRRFHDKAGTQSPFVAWEALTPALLETALECMPAAHLRRLFERLLADLRANCSGLPDLVRFWPAEQRYELIEVKGPGDRLQDNQRRWLAYCMAHGIPVQVCHVRWT